MSKLLVSTNESSQSAAGFVILAIGILICCGLPFLLLAGGGLALLAAVTQTEALLLAGLAVLGLALALTGIRVRNERRNRRRGE